MPNIKHGVTPPVADGCASRPDYKGAAQKKLQPGEYHNATIVVGADGLISGVTTGERVLYQAGDPCCPVKVSVGGSAAANSTQSIFFASTDCIIQSGVGTALEPFKFTLKSDCAGAASGTGVTSDQCGYRFSDGLVKGWTPPIARLTSSDGSLSFSGSGQPDGSCTVDVKLSGTATAISDRTFRPLCAVGNCDAAGRAIGFVWIEPIGTEFGVVSCALAGQGATGAAIAVNNGPFATIAEARTAMNAATLTAAFGSCAGGGP
jgi:hypothetical protein